MINANVMSLIFTNFFIQFLRIQIVKKNLGYLVKTNLELIEFNLKMKFSVAFFRLATKINK